MSKEINDGGSVFPYDVPSPTTGKPVVAIPGLSLRDLLAAVAMHSMTAGPGATMVAARDERYDETNWAQVVASNAYDFADAMIKERDKR